MKQAFEREHWQDDPYISEQDDPTSQANRLLGVLQVTSEKCSPDAELKVLLWYAIDAAIRQQDALQQIRRVLKRLEGNRND